MLGIGLLSSSPRKLFQIMISGINLEIVSYFKIVIVEKLITINKINLHQQSSLDLAYLQLLYAYYLNSTSTGYKTFNTSSNTYIIKRVK